MSPVILMFSHRSDNGPHDVGPFDDRAAAERHVDGLRLSSAASEVIPLTAPADDTPTTQPSSDTDITASPVLRGRHHPSEATPTGHIHWCMATTPTGEKLPLTGAALHHVCRKPDGHFLTERHACDVCGHTWPINAEPAVGTNQAALQALTEYGDAIQGDWGDLDGRTVNRHLGSLAALLRTPPDQPPTIQHLRTELGICPDGGGHWTEHCQDTCDIPTTQPKLGETQACTIADIHTPHDDCNGRIFGMRPPAGVPDPTTIPTKLD